ncbi:hypothetical protein N9L68_02075 [bacterium]|nr:hypothetical protein [bacterium]
MGQDVEERADTSDACPPRLTTSQKEEHIDEERRLKAASFE